MPLIVIAESVRDVSPPRRPFLGVWCGKYAAHDFVVPLWRASS